MTIGQCRERAAPAASDRRHAQRVVAGSGSYEARDRASFSFAVASVAAAVDVTDGVVRDVRLAFGSVAPRPWRAYRAEDVLRGGPPTREAFLAAADAELAEARPLRDNAYKVTLLRNLVVAVLTGLAGETA